MLVCETWTRLFTGKISQFPPSTRQTNFVKAQFVQWILANSTGGKPEAHRIHCGRYSYEKLLFGISLAPEIFQRKMQEMLDGLDGVLVYIDDMLVCGATMQEHDKRLS